MSDISQWIPAKKIPDSVAKSERYKFHLHNDDFVFTDRQLEFIKDAKRGDIQSYFQGILKLED